MTSPCMTVSLRAVLIVAAVAAFATGSTPDRPRILASSIAFGLRGCISQQPGCHAAPSPTAVQRSLRVVGSHYEALVEGKWLAVPPETMVEATDNPTGRAVVCWLPWSGILCFVKGPES